MKLTKRLTDIYTVFKYSRNVGSRKIFTISEDKLILSIPEL